MAPKLSITHIGTATAILDINGVNMITDPFFSPAGTEFPITDDFALVVREDPALRLDQLPVIDGVLLSHEDHPDNLDDLGRQLLNGRPVFTTMDGAKKLSPRPTVHGFEPWQKLNQVRIAGKLFQIIATPAKHKEGDECTGFLITGVEGYEGCGNSFGFSDSGLPNAIYFSGDTVYIPELKRIAEQYHICAAIMNLGDAQAPCDIEDPESGMYQITMDGKSAARLFRDLKVDCLVPMHYEAWDHFTEDFYKLKKAFEDERIADKVMWLDPGRPVAIL
ncbi:hypothetical protein CKM354_000002100 [Cercospora kikuchii]|uniref:Metallo-beta-lactamase domain-containing protein n=1 Tax=Cercospora kikuchii TaxID=84275 RepID=A0A9P3CAF9_9PEZI|nr:uncharacterized protein CKM354_000002100 [Cercospora kikuchii]GIZ36550.1 hypothetical protein CKM354_000002100 [Cercospora kikuchii]